MKAREDILSRIASRKPKSADPVSRGTRRSSSVSTFIEQAEKVEAKVRHIASLSDLPEAVADYLRDNNLPARICLPSTSALNRLDWPRTVEIAQSLPGIDETAVSLAAFGIAETGTLVHAASANTPASWHFRPGLEIVAVRRSLILSTLEDVLDRLGEIPSTLNLVSGPSRTADIEQTLEVGAHGPKGLLVLVIDGE